MGSEKPMLSNTCCNFCNSMPTELQNKFLPIEEVYNQSEKMAPACLVPVITEEIGLLRLSQTQKSVVFENFPECVILEIIQNFNTINSPDLLYDSTSLMNTDLVSTIFEKILEIKNKHLFTVLIDNLVETVVKQVDGNLDTSVDSPATDRETETERETDTDRDEFTTETEESDLEFQMSE